MVSGFVWDMGEGSYWDDCGLGRPESGQRFSMKLTRCQMSSWDFSWSLKAGIEAPWPSRMLRKISPSVMPLLKAFGSDKSLFLVRKVDQI